MSPFYNLQATYVPSVLLISELGGAKKKQFLILALDQIVFLGH